MHDIVSLIDDHDIMDDLADRLIAGARAPHVSPASCRRLMDELCRRLADHLAQEDAFLYGDRAGAVRSAFDDAVSAFEIEFAELFAHWDAYHAHWSEAEIALARSRFAGETTDMMTAFKLRLERENGVLYPLALDAGRLVHGGAVQLA